MQPAENGRDCDGALNIEHLQCRFALIGIESKVRANLRIVEVQKMRGIDVPRNELSVGEDLIGQISNW